MAAYRADMGVPDTGAAPEFPGAVGPDKKPGTIGMMCWALKQWIFATKEDQGNAEAYKTEDQAKILTADKKADLLARMGLPIEELFDADMRDSTVLISDKPGGAPLSVVPD